MSKQLSTYQKLRLVTGPYVTLMNPIQHFPSKMEFHSIRLNESASTYPLPGLPCLHLCDGPQGIRRTFGPFSHSCTAYPSLLCLAATFSRTTTKKIGQAIASDALRHKIGCVLAPSINIVRHPLTGRAYESFGEDPALSGELAAAFVDGIESCGVSSCVKHFAANNQETEREDISIVVSQRALRQIYCENFRRALQTKPHSVMSSYNKVNGIYASENIQLIQMLQDEFEFDGILMTDWFAGDNAASMLLSGHNLIEPGTPSNVKKIQSELETNEDLREKLNVSARKMIKFIKDFAVKNNPVIPHDEMTCKKIARDVAAEGCVLLKNNSALPINSHSRIALGGTAAYRNVATGIGSGEVNVASNSTVFDGLRKMGIFVDQALLRIYSDNAKKESVKSTEKYKGFFHFWMDNNEISIDRLIVRRSAVECNEAILVISRVCGEFRDRTQTSFYLSSTELEMIDVFSTEFHAKNKKVVVVLNIGSVVEMASWENKVDGIMVSWINGEEGGDGVANILLGITNPSGRLPITFPEKLEEVATKNFPGDDAIKPKECIYDEDIYVGYRFYTTFQVNCSYPFGYGLSYTSFNYEDLTIIIDKEQQIIEMSVVVMNSGTRCGKDVVQFYISSPEVNLEQPNRELKGFEKTETLAPGEKQVVSIKTTLRDLSSFDEKSTSWLLEAGTYTVYASKHCFDVSISTTFVLDETIITKKTQSYAAPTKQFDILSKHTSPIPLRDNGVMLSEFKTN